MSALKIDEWIVNSKLNNTDAEEKAASEIHQPLRNTYEEWSKKDEADMLFKCNWNQLPLFSRYELVAKYISEKSDTSLDSARIIVKEIGLPSKVKYTRKDARVNVMDISTYQEHPLYLVQNDSR